MVNEYIERHAKPNQRTWQDTRRRLQRELIRLYGNRIIKDIGCVDINRMRDDIRDRGVGIGAHRLLAHTKRFFAWYVERGLIDNSPSEGVRRPVKEINWDRVLTDDELVAIWRATDELKFPCAPAFRLLLLLGKRRDKVGRMRWRHLNLEAASWILPADENKSGRLHVVPLPFLAIDILNELPKVSDFVF